MLRPVTFSERLLFTTTKVEVRLSDGTLETGTGVFYRHDLDEGRHVVFLITNRHLMECGTSATFYVRLADSSDRAVPSHSVTGVEVPSPAAASGNYVHHHPDPEIDLCAVNVTPSLIVLNNTGTPPFYLWIGPETIPAQAHLDVLNAVEEVLMVGHPRGLADDVTKLPLFRRGITSFHPAFDFGAMPIGVVDMACYPGSSGSPIFIIDEGSFIQKDGTPHPGPRHVFLGLLYEGPTITSDVLAPIGTAEGAHGRVRHLIHLGYYVKAREVSTLVKHALLAEGFTD